MNEKVEQLYAERLGIFEDPKGENGNLSVDQECRLCEIGREIIRLNEASSREEEIPASDDYALVANTIWEQLGGRRFGVMTGVKMRFCEAVERGALSFFLPRGLAKDGIIRVRIVLTWRDTYTVTFLKKSKDTLAVVETCEDIYADNLQECFTRVTGLATHL